MEWCSQFDSSVHHNRLVQSKASFYSQRLHHINFISIHIQSHLTSSVSQQWLVAKTVLVVSPPRPPSTPFHPSQPNPPPHQPSPQPAKHVPRTASSNVPANASSTLHPSDTNPRKTFKRPWNTIGRSCQPPFGNSYSPILIHSV
jgi:hypothetical protein